MLLYISTRLLQARGALVTLRRLRAKEGGSVATHTGGGQGAWLAA